MTTSTVVRLAPGDWAELRDIRLRALADAPDAFAAVLADAQAYDDEVWRERLATGNPTYVVREGGSAVAMAGGFAPDDSPEAFVWGMWTAPEARGRGHSGALLEAVVTWAHDLGRVLHLHVTEGNDVARRLYVRRGFEPTGTWEPLREGSPLRVEELSLSRG
ncbi:GNAT family N-acetyltransferase [Nocardioides pinisoli]|uniref:GNAT family N-acetyltransferase n=1 Tax=Nocardioides pinisoli TaxID=2950279 RepID=A0ABT1L2V3_9ACTN|nr:GNAT family N-acetyltransferase [Nocardioides pinisoli]MCP3424353.1 GNAT family N-acetyltransferase [Nocardioides pinisoli]